MRTFLLVSMLLALVMPAQVLAQDTGDPGTLITQLLGAIQGRNWILIVSAVLSGAIYVVRRWGLAWIPWFGTDRGGAVLTVVVGILGALASALATGHFMASSFVDGLVLAMNTAGGFVLVKRILAPSDVAKPSTT